MSKRNIPLFLVIFALLSAIYSGCSSKDQVTDANPTAGRQRNITIDSEQAYKVVEISLPTGLAFHEIKFMEDEIFLFDWQNLVVIDYDGNEKTRVQFSEDEYFFAMDLLPDFSFWGITPHYIENAASRYGADVEKISIARFSREGNELERVDIKSPEFTKSDDLLFPRGLKYDGSYFYIMSHQNVYVIDKSGNVVMEMGAVGVNPRDSTGYFLSLFKLNDGRVAAASLPFSTSSHEEAYLIQIPDLQKKEINELKISVSGGSLDTIFATGIQNDVLLCGGNGFHDFDLTTLNSNLIFSNLKHGIDIKSLKEIEVFADGTIVIAQKSEERNIDRLVKLIPTDESEVIVKQAVEIATIYIEDWFKNAVAEFNKTNEKYYVEIKDYTDNGKTDEEDAVNRFNIDLITGNIPDIIMLVTNIPSNSYVNKGIYADLYSFIDNDPDFDKNNYLPGLFTAMERDGKLYEMFPMFSLNVILGKTTDLGTGMGWNLDEFAAFLETKPEPQFIFGEFTRRDFVRRMIEYQFVDPLTGEIHFERDDFKKILDIAERFPVAFNESARYNEFLAGARDGDPLLLNTFLFNFTTATLMEYSNFGEEITLRGYPTPDRGGIRFSPMNYFGIAAGAENPDGAWEFLKYILDTYHCIYNFHFHVRLSLLDEMIGAAKEYFADPTTTFTSFQDGVRFEGRASDLEFSDKTIIKVLDAVKSANKINRINRTIRDIILEEVDSYLGGQKSIDTVVEIIVNRIGIYLAELE